MAERKEIPILMTTFSVRAIKAGRKTRTRRLLRPQPAPSWAFTNTGQFLVPSGEWVFPIIADGLVNQTEWRCPYGDVGDILWVREAVLWDSHGFHSYWADYLPEEKRTVEGVPVDVLAGLDAGAYWKRPSIHMPKAYCRMWLENRGVRPQRLQNISEEDAYAEGIDLSPTEPHPIDWFRQLWDSIYAVKKMGWDENPFVWIVALKETERPSDG